MSGARSERKLSAIIRKERKLTSCPVALLPQAFLPTAKKLLLATSDYGRTVLQSDRRGAIADGK